MDETGTTCGLEACARTALGRYDIPPQSSAALINISENATFRIDAADGRRWALRLHRYGYHSDEAIASELHWMMALRNEGIITTPAPVRGRDGQFLQRIELGRGLSPRRVVLFQWEEGAEPEIGLVRAWQFEQLGEIAARMHKFTQTLSLPTWFTRHTWDFDTCLGDQNPHWGRWRDGIGMNRDLEPLFERTAQTIGRRLSTYGKSSRNFGLIHADLRLANLLFDGENAKVIDFDDSGFGWYMYDAATPVSFHEDEPQVPELINAWKQGYRRIMPIAKKDEAEIDTFLMLRRLLLVAWIGSHQDADLPRVLGGGYTERTAPLCERYLAMFG